MDLSDEKVAAYVKDHYDGQCPCCGSEEIEGGSIDISGREAWQKVTCIKCAAGWIDTYDLSHVELCADPDLADWSVHDCVVWLKVHAPATLDESTWDTAQEGRAAVLDAMNLLPETPLVKDDCEQTVEETIKPSRAMMSLIVVVVFAVLASAVIRDFLT